jgi:hypothetical protein
MGSHSPGTLAAERLEDPVPKYELDIEGQIHEWDRDTITLSELRQLAGYAPDQQMIEVDLKDNTETALIEGTPIELRPGKGFAKKVAFKRG